MTETARPGSGSETDQTTESPFPRYLSPSQIKGLLTCGWQFALTRLYGVPERPMWAGIGGSTVHRLTELHDREAYADGNA
jgi:hypothetical protein